MPKANIHPDYHEITVVLTDGSSFKTRSTYGKKDATLKLDTCPKSHPAWSGGGIVLNEKEGKISSIRKRNGNFSLTDAKKPAQTDPKNSPQETT